MLYQRRLVIFKTKVPLRQVLRSTFYKWRNCGAEWPPNLLKILAGGRAGI